MKLKISKKRLKVKMPLKIKIILRLFNKKPNKLIYKIQQFPMNSKWNKMHKYLKLKWQSIRKNKIKKQIKNKPKTKRNDLSP